MSSPDERGALAGAWVGSNATAFAVAGPDALLISTRQARGSWSALSSAERADVLALVDELAPAGHVDFALVAPAGERWHLRVRPPAHAFAGLPGFVGGEEQQLLPALQAALGLADGADLLAAFVRRSGLDVLRDDLEDALRRGASVRVLTGDYLGFTEPDALRELLAMSAEFERLTVAVYRCPPGTSFHPKAYIFRAGPARVAYVGSSNLSRSALTSGVEWNLRTRHDAHELAAIEARFAHLWRAPETTPLTSAWIDDYAARAPTMQLTAAWDPPPRPPTPHAIQQQALDALARAQASGAMRGLVVLATGLGKTLLAAFAALQMGARRVLFVAHRAEILGQARRAFAAVLPTRSTGLFMGPRRDATAELLFASVQTLARPEQLATWPKDHFDLVVIDEFHHAAALGYRRILGHFTPRFLLGITATPERGDGASLLALCADNLVFRADLAQGIACGRLVPFVYHGLKDAIDYQAIPWRSGRFDPTALSAALATLTHAEQSLAGYREHAPEGPRRGLWFCASIAHAEFMAAFLRARGVEAVAVHSEPGGAPRAASLRALQAGELEAITTVDVFNEGVDAPDINVVVLLRPTGSRVVFLQQIGRGLRLPERSNKPRLVILDFIGNHRSFLARPEALCGLLGMALGGRAATRRLREADLPLPPGCSVHIETEVIELLTRLARDGGGDQLLATLTRLRDELGRRPTLVELAAEGLQVGAVARAFGSWWQLLARAEELGPDEQRVFDSHSDALIALETARIRDPASWSGLAHWLELGGVAGPVAAEPALLELWPEALVRRGDGITLRAAISESDVPVLEAMIDEICAARGDAARRARAVAELPTGTAMKVLRNTSGRPIMMFTRTPETPTGEQEVWIEGEPYTLRFVKLAVNVARAREGGPNLLGAILRGLFGPHAGEPGTDHRAVLRRVDGRWTLIPSLEEPTDDAAPLPYHADLAVACGLADTQHSGADTTRTITIHSEHIVDPRRHFVVRARGDSMNGGPRPIRDGDLVLCARLDAPPPELVEGRPCLLVAHTGPDASEAFIKVPTRAADGAWLLRSWSSGQVDLAVARWEALRIVARVVGVVQAR